MSPYIESLAGKLCPVCKGEKQRAQSFCYRCFYTLPKTMRQALYSRVGEGYEQAHDAAMFQLRAEPFRAKAQAG